MHYYIDFIKYSNIKNVYSFCRQAFLNIFLEPSAPSDNTILIIYYNFTTPQFRVACSGINDEWWLEKNVEDSEHDVFNEKLLSWVLAGNK